MVGRWWRLCPRGRSALRPRAQALRARSVHPGQVTVPWIVAHLRDLGMAISKRQVVRLLIAGKEDFLAEAAGVLKSGLESAAWITVDDTGARYRA